MKNPSIKIGDIFKDNGGEYCTVIEYISSNKILLQYRDGYTQYRKASSLRNGFIRDISSKGEFEKDRAIYKMLKKKHSSILKRTSKNKRKIKNIAYSDVSICESWLDFNSFYIWAVKQVGHEYSEWNIDKDILVKGNRIYSPETCCFVPARINMLFVRKSSKRGDYPIGVNKKKNYEKYRAACGSAGKYSRYLGEYNTPEEAFYVYKYYKEALIKSVAEEYKNYISDKVYNSLISYVVEITD